MFSGKVFYRLNKNMLANSYVFISLQQQLNLNYVHFFKLKFYENSECFVYIKEIHLTFKNLMQSLYYYKMIFYPICFPKFEFEAQYVK